MGSPVITDASEYQFTISGKRSAEIAGQAGRAIHYSLFFSNGGPRSQELTLVHGDEPPLLSLRRERRFPSLRYAIVHDGKEVGSVCSSGLLRSQFSVAVRGKRNTLLAPMFTAHFRTAADGEDGISVRVVRQNCWNVRMGRNVDAPEWIGAIALIFVARWESWYEMTLGRSCDAAVGPPHVRKN
jgi:hypothetical protein